MNRIDTCGMACPQPVLMTKVAIKSNPASFEIIVDNNTAKNNIERFLKSAGYNVDFKTETDIIIILASK